MRQALFGCSLLALLSCGPPAVRPDPDLPNTEPATYQGRIQFEMRRETPTGASREGTMAPARRVHVRVVDEQGQVLGEGVTDDDGRYAVDATEAARAIEVVAHVTHEHDLAVTRDPGGLHDHVHSVPLAQLAVTSGQVEEIQITDREPMAGALHILDMLLEGARAVRAWVGETLPPFFAYWDRGVTTDWSFYTGERPHGSGRYTIELLGGEPGRQHLTDTDEHDELIVLHEFGHFVFDVLSSNSSAGGQHPRGYLLEPGLAWEEGRATWFATMVKRSPKYLDTIGIEPSGSLRVSHDLERGHIHDVRGVGSESSVAEVLWDLADGAEGIPDSDHDPVALGPAGVMQAMIDIGRAPGAHPALPNFLRHVVDEGLATEEHVRAILVLGGHPMAVLPAAGTEPWPRALAIGQTVSDKIDGLTNPAPSGGPPRPLNGQDAVHVYRMHLPQGGRVLVTLEVAGSGRGEDHEDADLELRDIRTDLLDRSVSETPRESISRELEPGWYLVVVRDGGQGNRVGYELNVRAM